MRDGANENAGWENERLKENVSPTLEHEGEAGEDGGMASKEQLTLTKRARTVRKKLREIERIAALPIQNLNEDQKEKLASKDEFLEELSALERQLPRKEAAQEMEAPSGSDAGGGDGAWGDLLPDARWGFDGGVDVDIDGGAHADDQALGSLVELAAEARAPVESAAEVAQREVATQDMAAASDSAAALAAAKRAGEAELEEDEWLVKGKDGKVKIVKEKDKKKKKANKDGDEGHVDPGPSAAAAPEPPPALQTLETQKIPASVAKVEGAKAPSHASQAAPLAERQKQQHEDVRRRELEKLKAGWRDGVFTQVMMEGHRSAISCLCIAGKSLISGGFDGIIKEWSLPSGELVRSLGGHSSAVRAVWAHAHDDVIFSGAEDCLIVLWDAKTGKQRRSINCYTPVRAMAGGGAAARLYTGHSDRSLRAYQGGSDGKDEEIFKVKAAHSMAFTSLSVVPASQGQLLISTDEGGECILWDLGDGGTQTPSPIWRCTHPDQTLARSGCWLPADRSSAQSGAAGTLVVGYDPAEFYAWTFPHHDLGEACAPRNLSVQGAEVPDDEMRACLAVCLDNRLMVTACTEPDGAGNLVVRLLGTNDILYKVTPEDMEGAASLAVNDRYIAFGGLDGWITLLEAVDPSKGKGRDLARVVRPPPPRKAKPAPKKTAAAAAKSATSTARGAPSASGRRQQAGDNVTPPGNSVQGKQAGKSDASYVAVAIGVALLAIFVAKVAASLIFQ